MFTPKVTVQETARMRRVMRNPEHSWHLRYKPWQIQPCLIAPVLPHETLKNALVQARTITDPIKNPLIGWWDETYLFHVKLRDLYDRDKLVAMLMNPEEDMTSLDSATKVEHFHTNGTSGVDIDWVKLCMERVVDEYFRYEGEDNTTGTIGNLPAANINHTSYIDSLILNSSYVTPADEDLTHASSEFGTAVNISEIHNAELRWNLMRQQGLTDMTFEDYLATYGVKPKPEEVHKPELIRYFRDWTYPVSHVNTSTGAPTSACSWVTKFAAEKDRYFREPGFIFGVKVTRPKVYLKGLNSNAVMLMNKGVAWLPPSLSLDPHSSMIKVSSSQPPVNTVTSDYWVDIKDLLLYGDQFVNFALTATDANIVNLPSATAAKRYAAAADVSALFVTATTAEYVKTDGICKMSIAGQQIDTSPNAIGTNITV